MIKSRNKSRTFLQDIKPVQKEIFNIHLSPQQAAGYSGKVRDKYLIAVALGLLVAGVFAFFYQSQETKNLPQPRTYEEIGSSLLPDPKTASPPQNPLPSKISLAVPFTSQAPDAEWDNPKFQDGCEEASVLMAMAWVNNSGRFSAEGAKREILAMADWQETKYGSYHDTSARDTAKRLFNEYFNYAGVTVHENISLQEIKSELAKNQLIIVPMDGTIVGNPNYTPPGPTRHMMVIIGYDEKKQEFTTNDPGTRRGKDYRYNYETFFNAIRDYPTGHKEPNKGIKKNMIVVSK